MTEAMELIDMKVRPDRTVFGSVDLIVYDFDGVMTDNRVLTFQDGTEAVWANRSDGLGINLIKELGITQIIISTESNQVVEARATKVGLPVMYNISNKLEALTRYCTKHSFDFQKTIFVGNDINDLEAMQAVAHPVAPSDAHFEIKSIAKLILDSKGGDGVIRELADILKD